MYCVINFYYDICQTKQNKNKMKTPRKKAAELIDKFTYWNTSEAEREGIKSALHCVAEIIGVKLLWFQKDTKEIEYWQEVRNEIDNL